jgi:F0F1-type ATP synthase assembly protein I
MIGLLIFLAATLVLGAFVGWLLSTDRLQPTMPWGFADRAAFLRST